MNIPRLGIATILLGILALALASTPAFAQENGGAGPLAGFTLVDVSDQSVLASFKDGASVGLADPDKGSYGIRADLASGETVGSVSLELEGPRRVAPRTENLAPYSLYGDYQSGQVRRLHGANLPAGSYTLRAVAYSEASLGGDKLGALEVSFTVVKVNRPPHFSQSKFSFDLEENNGAGWQTGKGSVAANDPDGPDDAITYAITGGNPVCDGCGEQNDPYRDSLFRITPDARVIYQGPGEDYESFPPGEARYQLTLTATDQGGATASAIITINIKDVPENSAPEITNKPAKERIAVAENTSGVLYAFTATDADGDTVEWSLSAEADGLFVISNDPATAGQLTLASGHRLDYERQDFYSFTVAASDGTDRDSVRIGLIVTNVEPDPPELVGMFDLVDATDQSVLALFNDGATLEVLDPDGGSYAIRVGLDRSSKEGVWIWPMDASVSLELTGAKTYGPRTENGQPYSLYGDYWDDRVVKLYGGSLPAGSYTLRVAAYSEENLGGYQLGTLEISFTVTKAERPPQFGSASYSFSVAEDAAVGAAVGVVSATDPNRDRLTYTVTAGNDDGKFAIDAGSGAVTVAGTLNYDTASSYALTVQVSDGNGGTDTATVNVSVTDMSQPPGIPVNPTGVSGNGQLTVSWTEPANAGPPVTGYMVQWKSGSQEYHEDRQATTTASSYTITGLTNGVTYAVRVRASNADGDGGWSQEANGTPSALPAAPDAPVLTPGDSQLDVSWTEPDNRGSAITGYTVQWKMAEPAQVDPAMLAGKPDDFWINQGGGHHTKIHPNARYAAEVVEGNDGTITATLYFSSSGNSITRDHATLRDAQVWGDYIMNNHQAWEADPGYGTDRQGTATGATYTISGLTNNVVLAVRVAASNGSGRGDWSDESSNAPNPALLPSAPDAPVLTLGNGQLDVSWNAPANEGTPITGYTVQWKSGSEEYHADRQAETAATSQTITGLANGTTYVVRVRASNSRGDGGWSQETSGMPDTPPSAPDAPTLEADDEELTVSWTAPDNEGTAITGYTVQWKSGSEEYHTDRQAVVTATSHTITGLTNGTAYAVRVRASNAAGDSGWSQEANGTPDAIAVTLTPGNGQLDVSWTVPAKEGTAIAEYTVQWKMVNPTQFDPSALDWTPGSQWWIFNGVHVHGTWGDGRYAQVRQSAAGEFKATVWLTDYTLSSSAFATLRQAKIWSEHVIAHYADWKSGSWEYGPDHQAETTATSYTITGLTNGVAYTVRIRDANESEWSGEVAGTPNTPPDAPDAPTLVPVNKGTIQASWTKPVNDGSPVINYTAAWREANGLSPSGSSTLEGVSMSISGLAYLTTWYVKVKACNAAGCSDWSDEAYAALHKPNPPQSITLEGGIKQIEVSWEAPEDNGSGPITGYRLSWHPEGDQDSSEYQRVDPTPTSYTITGLSNETTYIVRVKAFTRVDTGSAGSGQTQATTSGLPWGPVQEAIEVDARGQLQVKWRTPEEDGGEPIESFTIRWQYGYYTPSEPHWWWNGSSSTVVKEVAPTDQLNTHTISGLFDDSWYSVQVRATNAVGDSIWSWHRHGQTAGTPGPVTLGYREMSGAGADHRNVILTWDTPDGEMRLPIEWRYQYRMNSPPDEDDEDYEEWWNDLAAHAGWVIGKDRREYTIFLYGRTSDHFSFRMRAENDVGNADWSNVLKVERLCREGEHHAKKCYRPPN